MTKSKSKGRYGYVKDCHKIEPGSKAEADLINRAIREGWMFTRPDQIVRARDSVAETAVHGSEHARVSAFKALLQLRAQDLEIAGKISPEAVQKIEIEFVNGEDSVIEALAAPAGDLVGPPETPALGDGTASGQNANSDSVPHPPGPPA